MEQKKIIEYVPVDSLEYDPENPRLPSSIDGRVESDVINWMLTDASIIELMGSIGEKGFFPAEPLLVVPDKSNSEKYIVIEGNRRLTAVKLLLRHSLAKKRVVSIKQIIKDAKIKPKELPVIIFKKREDILDYLGFKHITGVKPWSALAKAKYLKDLQKSYKDLPPSEQYKRLAKAIGSRADYVKDLLTTYPVYQKIEEKDFFDIDNLDENNIDFGVYYNALKYPNISKFIGVDVEKKNPTRSINIDNLEKLTRWVSEKDSSKSTRLGESRNLTKLNDVLGNAEALNQFEKGRSLEDASKYTDNPYMTMQGLIVESLTILKEAYTYVPHVKRTQMSDVNVLDELLSTAEDLQVLLKNKLKGK